MGIYCFPGGGRRGSVAVDQSTQVKGGTVGHYCDGGVSRWLNDETRPELFSEPEWETNVRLCQCMIAFGIGAGPIRVRAEAAGWLYGRLWAPFHQQVVNHRSWWKNSDGTPQELPEYRNHAAQVLDLCRAVGRLAADLATREGGFVIELRNVIEAFDVVSERVAALEGDQKLEQLTTSGL